MRLDEAVWRSVLDRDPIGYRRLMDDAEALCKSQSPGGSTPSP